jgi:photosystem II stability/assembly factor-like uncharacterized protein
VHRIFTVIDTQTGKTADWEAIVKAEEWAVALVFFAHGEFVVGERGALYISDTIGRLAECPKGRFEVVWEKTAL